MENVELGHVIHGALLRDNEGISLEGNLFLINHLLLLLLLKVLFLSYYLIDVILLVVGLKEIFIENIGFVLWGEIILLNVNLNKRWSSG